MEKAWDQITQENKQLEEERRQTGGFIIADKKGIIWGLGWSEDAAWADFVKLKNDKKNNYPTYWGESELKSIPATYDLIWFVEERGADRGFIMIDGIACVKPTKSPMQPDQFRAALADLGYSQAGFARLAMVDARTVRRWCDGTRAVPGPVVALLRMIERQGFWALKRKP